MKKLNSFVKKDNRIQEVYDYVKEKYESVKRVQHNWEHVLRDLYRALVIAETVNNVNYSVLIPAVLLHDIGVTESEEYEKHAELGSEIVKRDMPDFGFGKKEVKHIAKCVELHKGKNKGKINTTEAKILFDSDRLEKSGIGGIFSSYRAQYELQIPIMKWIEKQLKRNWTNEDLFTDKARKISENGFSERKEHFKKAWKSLKERKDWTVEEKDLWE